MRPPIRLEWKGPRWWLLWGMAFPPYNSARVCLGAVHVILGRNP